VLKLTKPVENYFTKLQPQGILTHRLRIRNKTATVGYRRSAPVINALQMYHNAITTN